MTQWPSPGDGGLCAGPCCLTEPCALTLAYVDTNRCEDDAFNIYLLWTDADGTAQQRFIDEIDMVSTPKGCCTTDAHGNPCPMTAVSVPLTVALDEVSPCCRIELKLVLDHSNCCSTNASFTLHGPGGSIPSAGFGPGGLDQFFDIRQLCNPAP